MKNIEKVYAILPGKIPIDDLSFCQRSEIFHNIIHFFDEYPADSLLSNNSRALLYHLMVSLHPKRAVEIGTYRAGTTEVLAARCMRLATYSRAFGFSSIPEELIGRKSSRLDGVTGATAVELGPLVSAFERSSAGGRRLNEITLAFEPDREGEILQLLEPPRCYPAKYLLMPNENFGTKITQDMVPMPGQ